MRLGLGRLRLHFLSHGLEEHRELLFRACLKNLVYDAQCEVKRAPWLVQLLTADQELELARLLLQTLPKTRGRDRLQQYDLCFCLARKGHSEAHKALYAGFRMTRDGSVFGAGEIIDLDSADGLRWVSQQALLTGRLRHRRERLEEFIWLYEDRAGKGSASSVFTSCPELKPYWPSSKQATSAVNWRRARRQANKDFAALAVEEMLAQIDSSTSRYYIPGLKDWARAANLMKLRGLADVLAEERDPHRLGHLLTLCAHRPLSKSSRYVSRLLALAEHQDTLVRLRANQALATVRHPAIRERALSQLKAKNWLKGEILPLKSNLMRGDAVDLERHLRVSPNDFHHHRLIVDLVSICQANPWPELLNLLLFVYETSPCTSCRHEVYQLMTGQSITPDWVAREWPYDAYQSWSDRD